MKTYKITFENGHKVPILLVGAFLHLLVVGHALLDLGAEKRQVGQLLGDIFRGLHLLQVGNSGVKHSHGCCQALLGVGILGTVSLRHAKLVVGLGYGPVKTES